MYVFEESNLILRLLGDTVGCWFLCGMPRVFWVLHWLIQYLLEAKTPFIGVLLYPCGVCMVCM